MTANCHIAVIDESYHAVIASYVGGYIAIAVHAWICIIAKGLVLWTS